MKLPSLSFLATTNVRISINDGLTDNGADKFFCFFDGLCRYQEKSETVTLPDGRKVHSKGSIFVFVDIAPTLRKIISGSATIDSTTFQIIFADRQTNPDGSFNHLLLKVM